MIINYCTTNVTKYEIAKRAMAKKGIELTHKHQEFPEVQSTDLKEILKYSISTVEDVIEPLALTDTGFYVSGLNGFPGPFVKHINGLLTPENILAMLESINDRKICVREMLVIMTNDRSTYFFQGEFQGKITKVVSDKEGSLFDRIVIPDGMNMTMSEIPEESWIDFWCERSVFNQIDSSLFA